MLTFIIGMFVGGIVGVMVMAILVASRTDQYVPMRKESECTYDKNKT